MSKKRKIHEKDRVQVQLVEKPNEYVIPTSEHDISLPAIIVFSGNRGSGKTYACITLMRHFEKKKYVSRTFLLCPTRLSNDLYTNLKILHPQDCYVDERHFLSDLNVILNQVKKDWDRYKQEQTYIHVFEKWMKCPHTLTLQEQSLLEWRRKGFPVHIPKPSHVLLVDDAQGTGLYSDSRTNLLNHIVIKHRHIPLTIALLAQSWVGIPRLIRLNTTQFAVYKTGDKAQLRQIYDTFGNTIEYEDFEKMYKEAVSVPHGFLFIDTVPKKEYMRFRSGFNQYLIPGEKEHV